MAVKPLLNDAYEAKFLRTLHQLFGRFLRDGERFALKAHETASDAWTLSVAFDNADSSLHLPLELALVAAENPKLSNDEARDLLIDFVGYFFERYFEGDRQVTLPLDWQKMPFGEYTIRARGWERNLMLEHAADRLLAGEAIDDVIQ